MPVPDADYALPGGSVKISDGNLRISPPAPGQKLTLLGATTGTMSGQLQVNDPIVVRSVGLAVAGLKNDDGSDSELSLAVEQAVAAGARNIEVVKIADTSDFATPADRWDALATTYHELVDYDLDIVHPVDAYADEELGGGSDAYGETRTDFRRQLQNFCHRAADVGQITRGVIGIKPLLKVALDESWTGGPTSEAQALFETPTLTQLNEWISHIQSQNGTLHDHSTGETALEGYVYGSVEESAGVISTLYDGWALDASGTIAYDEYGEKVDGGRYVRVFGAAVRQRFPAVARIAAQNGYGGQTSINTNGAVAYAAYISTRAPWESATNAPVPSLVAARAIPESLGKAFLNARITTMVNRTRGLRVVADITGAHNANEYTRSDYVNGVMYGIVSAACEEVLYAGEPYYGKLNNPGIMSALGMAIEQRLARFKNVGAVQEIRKAIIQLEDDAILGNVDVELEIKAYNEIRRIKVRAGLSRLGS